MSDIADILERAADLIEPEGAWIQGQFGSRARGCYCVIGALHQLRWDDGGSFDRYLVEPCEFFQPLLGGPSIAFWNDAPERTQAEVVAKLREAAAKARGEQP